MIDSLGVCFTDCGAPGFFSFVSGYVGYALVADHDMNLVPQIGLGFFNVGNGTTTAPSSALLATVEPSVLWGWRVANGFQIFTFAVANLGFAGRDNSPIPDSAAVHFEPRFEIAPRITLAPFIEYFLPFAHTDFYSVPVGAGLYVVPDRGSPESLRCACNGVSINLVEK